MNSIKVSIIMINFNGRELLAKWVKSLGNQSYKNSEIIIVDNGSTDGSTAWLKKYLPQAKLMINKTNVGFPKACTQAVKKALGKYLFFINNDLELSNTCLEKLVDFLDTHEQAALAGPVIYDAHHQNLEQAGFFPTLSGFFLYSKQVLSQKPYEVFGASVAMLMKREFYDKINGFDTDFFIYSEEVDFCFRLRMILGKSIWLVPQATVDHLGGATSKKMNKGFIIFHGTKGRLFMLFKNLSWPFLLIIIPIHLLLLLMVIFFFLILGKFEQAKGMIGGIWWNITHLNLIFQKRQLVQSQRQLSDWQILKKFIKILPIQSVFTTTIKYLKKG